MSKIKDRLTIYFPLDFIRENLLDRFKNQFYTELAKQESSLFISAPFVDKWIKITENPPRGENIILPETCKKRYSYKKYCLLQAFEFFIDTLKDYFIEKEEES